MSVKNCLPENKVDGLLSGSFPDIILQIFITQSILNQSFRSAIQISRKDVIGL